MFIEELTIRGYGRLKDFRIEPGPGLNLIHGANESGKSSVGNAIRDLLLGPGRWDAEDAQGPHGEEARPWDGSRFQARVRYRTDDGRSFTLQRDFESGDVRVRDNDSGTDVALEDGMAPGLRLPRSLFDGDEPDLEAPPAAPAPTKEEDLASLREQASVLGARVDEAQMRARKAEDDVARAGYLFRKTQALSLSERLDQVRDLERSMTQLRARLQAVERFSGVRADQREIVLRNQARLEALDQEMAENRRSLETLQETRKSVGQRLSQHEKFYLVKPEDVTALQSLDLGERMSPAALEEKQRNIAGFQQKEADVGARLAEIAPRFSQFESDDVFEQRVGSLEKDVARTETMAGREAEIRENDRRIGTHHKTGARFMLWALLLALMAGVIGWLSYQFFPGLWWASALAGLVAVAGLVMKVREDRASAEIRFATGRITEEVDRMRVNIDRARDGLRAIFDTTGVTTIKDLRASYREYRALQRDLATVRAYIWNLERDVEAGRAQDQGRAETPRILVETGVISEWEPVTAHAVSSFMDAWKQFQAVVAEEDGLKRRIHELMRDLDSRREEEEKLKVRQSALLREMGVAAVQELDWAIMGRQEYDRLKTQVQPLEERVQALLQGVPAETARVEYQSALAMVKRYEEGGPEKRVGVDPGKLETYRAAFGAAEEALAAAQAQARDLEAELAAVLERARAVEQPASAEAAVAVGAAVRGGGAAIPVAPPVSPLEALTRRIQEVYREITLQEIVLRVTEVRGHPVLQVQRPGAASGWMSPRGLGRAASDLLQSVLRVELALGPRGGNLPLLLENPFARLDPQRQQRAAEWLIGVSARAQLFVMVEEAELRDLLRGLLEARGVPFTGAREGDLGLLAAQTPAA